MKTPQSSEMVLRDLAWHLLTGKADDTLVINIYVIILGCFLGYVLHPFIYWVRAYRAWRAMNRRQTVDVTSRPILAEILGGRRKWYTARIMLLALSLASWVLELSLEIASIEGYHNLLSRPPSPILMNIRDSSWRVRLFTYMLW